MDGELPDRGAPAISEHEERELKARMDGLRQARHRMPVGSMKPQAIKYSVLFLIFLVLALVVFLPIASNMTSVAPGTGGDTYQNLWDVWWVGYATFTLHSSIWYTSLMFPPLGASLVFQTMSPIGSLLSVPFQAVNTVFAYDTIFMLSFACSGVTMFVLAEYVSRNRYAAFIAALAFSFSAFHFVQAISHINWMFIAWVPLAVYFFIRIMRGDNGLVPSIGLGASLVLAMFMGDVEQGIMLVETLALVLVAYAIFSVHRRRIASPRFWRQIIVAAVVTLALGSFAFIPIAQALSAPNALSTVNQYTLQQTQLWSDNLLSFFLPSPFNGVFHGAASGYAYVFGVDPWETVSYAGYAVLLLSIYGIYRDRRRARLWIALALIFGWLAIGPYLNIGPVQTGIPGIYYAYSGIPILNVIREPGRFDLIASMALAVLAAIGFGELLKNGTVARHAFAATIIVSAIIVLEGSGIMTASVAAMSTTQVSIPQVYYGLAQSGGNFSVLNIPALPNQYSANPALYIGKATFYTSVTHKPTVSGYVTRQNATQTAYILNVPLALQAYTLQLTGSMSYSSPVMQNYTNQTLLTLYNYGVGAVAVDTAAFNQSSSAKLLNYLASVFGQPVIANSTALFGTSKAISASVFRSFVSYPVAQDWATQKVLINGTQMAMWVPVGYGEVAVYAPYYNVTDVQQKMASGYSEPVNATITFGAMYSGAPASLYVQALSPQGTAYNVAQINLTSRLTQYSVNMTMYSGPRTPTTLLFRTASLYNSSYTLMSGITISGKADVAQGGG